MWAVLGEDQGLRGQSCEGSGRKVAQTRAGAGSDRVRDPKESWLVTMGRPVTMGRTRTARSPVPIFSIVIIPTKTIKSMYHI